MKSLWRTVIVAGERSQKAKFPYSLLTIAVSAAFSYHLPHPVIPFYFSVDMFRQAGEKGLR